MPKSMYGNKKTMKASKTSGSSAKKRPQMKRRGM